MSEKILGTPTKAYFINMITKDIALEDSILDLIDNCLDGARRQICREKGEDIVRPNYDGYEVKISLNEHQFSIEDNCGGIDIGDAKNYVFNFGKRAASSNYSLGLSGIGMKRAIFKIGQHIRIQSSTKTAAFSVDIDINQWAAKENEWDFEIQPEERWANPGTRIGVGDINKDFNEEFADPIFTNILKETIARTFFLCMVVFR